MKLKNIPKKRSWVARYAAPSAARRFDRRRGLFALEQRAQLRQQAAQEAQFDRQPLLGARQLQEALLHRIGDLKRVADQERCFDRIRRKFDVGVQPGELDEQGEILTKDAANLADQPIEHERIGRRLLAEVRRFDEQIWATLDDTLDAEPLPPDRVDVEAALLERRHVVDLGGRPHLVRRNGGVAGLVAVADQRDAERRAVFQALRDHLLVARFEDVEVEHRPRKQDRVEREDPQPARLGVHRRLLLPSPAPPPAPHDNVEEKASDE